MPFIDTPLAGSNTVGEWLAVQNRVTAFLEGNTMLINEVTTGNISLNGVAEFLANVSVDGNFVVQGVSGFTGNTDFGGYVNVAGVLIVVGTAGITGNATFGGYVNAAGKLVVAGNAAITGNVTMSHFANIAGNLTVGGLSNQVGNAVFGGDVSVAGNLSVTGVASTGNLTVTGTFAPGNTSIIGYANVSNTLQVQGNGRFNANVTIDGFANVNTTLQVTGNSHFIANVVMDGSLNVASRLSVVGVANLGSLVVSGPWVDVKAYGATGDGVTDDSAAIQAAINSFGTGAGSVLFPPGVYVIHTGLSLDNKTNMRLLGVSGAQYSTANAGRLNYTNTTGSLITTHGAKGIEIAALSLVYSNTSYDDILIDLSEGPSGNLTSSIHIHHCRIGGTGGFHSANTLIYLDLVADIDIDHNQIFGANVAIRSTSASYINANRIGIRKNYFNSGGSSGISTCPILAGGQAWSVIENVFEDLVDGTGVSFDTTSVGVHGLRYEGNWHGDASVNSVWFKATGGQILGATIHGNEFQSSAANGGAIALGSTDGVSIIGNRFDQTYGVDLGTSTRVRIGENSRSGSLLQTPLSGNSSDPTVFVSDTFYGVFTANAFFHHNITLDPNSAGQQFGALFLTTGAGANTQQQTALGVSLQAGYTGNANTFAGIFTNLSANGNVYGVKGLAGPTNSGNIAVGIAGSTPGSGSGRQFGGFFTCAGQDPATMNLASISAGDYGVCLGLSAASNFNPLIVGWNNHDDGRWVFQIGHTGQTAWQSSQTVNTMSLTVTASNGGTTGLIQAKGSGDFAFVVGTINNANTRLIVNSVTVAEMNSSVTNVTTAMRVQGLLHAFANATFDGFVNVASTLQVTDISTLTGNVEAGGYVNVATTLQVGGNTIIGGWANVALDLNVAGNAAVTGKASVSGNLVVGGISTLQGNTTMQGFANVQSTIQVTGVGLFGANVTFQGFVNVSTSTLQVFGNTSISNLIASGWANVAGAINVAGLMTQTGNATFSGYVNVASTLQVTGISTLTGNIEAGGYVNVASTLETLGNATFHTVGNTATTYHPQGTIAQNTTTVTVGANTDYQFQNVATIKANTLKNVGDKLRIRAVFQLGISAGSHVYNGNFGATAQGVGGFTGGANIWNNGTAANSTGVIVEAVIMRIGSNSVAYWARNNFTDVNSVQGAPYTTASIDLTVDEPFAIGISDAGANSAVSVKYCDVTYEQAVG